MIDYRKQYQSFDLSKLYEILHESHKYEALALESATQELIERGVSSEEINNVITGSQAKLKEIEEENESINTAQSVKSKGLFETIDTINHDEANEDDEKQRKYLFYFLLMLALYDYSGYITSFYSILTTGIDHFTYPMSNIISDVIFIYGLYAFWNKMKNGWIIIAAMYVAGTIVLGYYWIDMLVNYSYESTLMINLEYAIYLVFQLGLVWILFRPFLFRIYAIKQKEIISMLILTLALSILYIASDINGF